MCSEQRLFTIAHEHQTITTLILVWQFDPKVSQTTSTGYCQKMNGNYVISILGNLTYFAVDLHWDRLGWYCSAVGYYRTAVGYYRVIAQETLKSKNSHQGLFIASKITKNGPVTAENHKNE